MLTYKFQKPGNPFQNIQKFNTLYTLNMFTSLH